MAFWNKKEDPTQPVEEEIQAQELFRQGRRYMEGQGVERDEAKAALLYHQAMGLWEDPEIDYEAGRCRYLGIGVERDLNGAMFLLQRSAGESPGAAALLMRHYRERGAMVPTLYYGQSLLPSRPETAGELAEISSGAAEGRLSSPACLERLREHPLYAKTGSVYHYAVDLAAGLMETGSATLNYLINQYLNLYIKAPVKLCDDVNFWTSAAMQFADGSSEFFLEPSMDRALAAACIALTSTCPPGGEMPLPRLRRLNNPKDLSDALQSVQSGRFSPASLEVLRRYAQNGNYYATEELHFLSGYLDSEQDNRQERTRQLKEQGCPLASGNVLLLAAAAIQDQDPTACLELARLLIGRQKIEVPGLDPVTVKLLGSVYLVAADALYRAQLRSGNLESSFRLGQDLHMSVRDHIPQYSRWMMYGVSRGYGPAIVKVVPAYSDSKVLGTASFFDEYVMPDSPMNLARSLPTSFFRREEIIQHLRENEKLARKLAREESARLHQQAQQVVANSDWGARQDAKERRWGLLYDGAPITAEERGWISAFVGDQQGVDNYIFYKAFGRDAAEREAVKRAERELLGESEAEKRNRLERERRRFQDNRDLSSTSLVQQEELLRFFSTNLVGISLRWISSLRSCAFDYQKVNRIYKESVYHRDRKIDDLIMKHEMMRSAAVQGHKLALWDYGQTLPAARRWHPQAMLRYYMEHPEEELGAVMLHRADYVGVPEAHFLQAKRWAERKENLEEAIRRLRAFAEEGRADAQELLADCYARGNGVEADGAEALRWMRLAADQQSPSAFYGMGRYYERGVGTAADPQEAIRWYDRAAQSGWGEASYRLALIYREGTLAPKSYLQMLDYTVRGVFQDNESCKQLFRRLTPDEAGDLAQHYPNPVRERTGGLFRRPSAEEQAFHRFQKEYQRTGRAAYSQDLQTAADAGFREALEALASLYASGAGVERDRYQAFALYTRAAQQGSAAALEQLARWFDSEAVMGYDNESLALCYANLAAQRGGGTSAQTDPQKTPTTPKGMFQMGVEYRHSNPAQAFRWFERSAQAGYAPGQLETGYLYDKGMGVTQDLEKAAFWYRKAAEQGNVQAMYNIGFCCSTGQGVPKDMEEAFRWFTGAAQAGHASAQMQLGIRLNQGLGTERNPEEAVVWHKKAAEQGISTSMCLLGFCYQDGEGVEKDEAEAFRWFERSAQAGNPDGQLGTGWRYETGSGVKQDPQKADYSYQKSAEQGNLTAMRNLAGCYTAGFGADKDPVQAVYWYKKAAEQGDAQSMYELGNCFANGQGAEKDEAEALRWYERAAQAGHANGQLAAGYRYDVGLGTEKDARKAIDWYEKAAEQGNTSAMRNLALTYENGDGVDKDPEKAVYWYKQAAEHGEPRSMYALGSRYADGLDVEKDETEAFRWFERAAQAGHADGQLDTGYRYDMGLGVEKDQVKAVYWYERSARQGNVTAMRNLGNCYANAWGVEKDDAQAVSWYRQAAEKGDARSMYNLGRYYANGLGVEKDEAEAFRWFERSAQAGHANGQLSTGYRYDMGLGVEKDQVKAVYWYEKSARQGNAAAMRNLGNCYANAWGVEKDHAQAVSWYRQAAEKGDAQCMYNLGRHCANGLGVEKDEAEAFRWFERAAQAGHASGQLETGYRYDIGIGVEKDQVKAVYWYEKSANQGNTTAMQNLGNCYANAWGVEKDPEKAACWYRTAAEKGYAPSMNSLGTCYKKGDGVEESLEQAVYWYRAAAEKGSAPAMCNLGVLLLDGKGVEQDPQAAAEWFRKAAEKNSARGKYRLAKCLLEGVGIPEDREAAVALLRSAAEQNYKLARELLDSLS